MRGRNAKLFRNLFNEKESYRRFKKAYTAAPLQKRLETIAMAKKIKATGSVKHMEIS
jgi:hypothetical protein